MNASWILRELRSHRHARCAPADCDASRRSSNGLSGVKAMPEFGALVKPLIDKPGKRRHRLDAGGLQRDLGSCA